MGVREEEHHRADALRNRAALLDAAAEVLAEAPQASVAEVATRAGLGRATLYRHFDSRGALLGAIREEALARARAAINGVDLSDCDTREGIRRTVRTLLPLGVRFRILVADGSDADADFVAARNEALAPLWSVLTRGVASGELSRTANTGWLGMVLAALLMTAVRATSAGVIDAAEAADQVADTFLDGFGTT